jgi:hypothetical protein
MLEGYRRPLRRLPQRPDRFRSGPAPRSGSTMPATASGGGSGVRPRPGRREAPLRPGRTPYICRRALPNTSRAAVSYFRRDTAVVSLMALCAAAVAASASPLARAISAAASASRPRMSCPVSTGRRSGGLRGVLVEGALEGVVSVGIVGDAVLPAAPDDVRPCAAEDLSSGVTVLEGLA